MVVLLGDPVEAPTAAVLAAAAEDVVLAVVLAEPRLSGVDDDAAGVLGAEGALAVLADRPLDDGEAAGVAVPDL